MIFKEERLGGRARVTIDEERKVRRYRGAQSAELDSFSYRAQALDLPSQTTTLKLPLS